MVKRVMFITGIMFFIATMFFYLRPVRIVAVHDHNTILVRHFPLLKSRKIKWWEANKKMIKEKYGIPVADEEGFYNVYILDFGDGYRADSGTDEDSDLLCFEDMQGPTNCIEKEPLFSISHSVNQLISYD